MSTIGQERQHNLALSATEDQFIAGVTGGQEPAPPYFVYAARRNHQLRPLLAEDERPIPLGVDQVVQLCRDGAVVLDTRPPDDFAAGHLRGSLNVGLDGRFAQYAGTIVCPDQPVVLVAPPGTESEAKVRLARVGFDGVGGYLPARRRGPPGATGAGRPGRPHTAAELGAWVFGIHNTVIVDVRNLTELAEGRIPGAVSLPLVQLVERLSWLDPARPMIVYCASGYRSSIAASVLRAAGFDDVAELLGGYQAWTRSRLP